MEDNYIDFELNNRKLKINKQNPYDILMLKTHSRYKLKNPRWNQLKIQTTPKGYKYINIKPKHYSLHRVNYYAHNPTWDIHDSSQDNFIDHIDNIKINNHIENLRVVTNQENQFNRKAKGYYWYKQRQKWMARIKLNGKQKFLGLFVLEEDARTAYLEAKKIYHIIK
tara:strand:+ start:276 stop:776 length:501 start_codon:yes stop_codon:yes gene_type:complete